MDREEWESAWEISAREERNTKPEQRKEVIFTGPCVVAATSTIPEENKGLMVVTIKPPFLMFSTKQNFSIRFNRNYPFPL